MRRRQFLSSVAAAGSASLFPGLGNSFAQSPAAIIDFTALQLSAAINSRQLSCVEVMDAYLAHIHRFNPSYNAIISLVDDGSLLAQARTADDELARGQYRGWMHGMPHAVKDLAAVAGLPFTSGSPMFADRIAESDSALAAQLRSAGAIFIGKTNTPEFGLGSQSYNPVFGATGCAYNPDLTAGGSSGGAACSLGTHMLPVADGSDMMGSLRNPGAYNNVIGFRPSVGIMGARSAFARSLSTAGPMGRNTRDTIQLLHTITAELGAEQAQSLHQALPADGVYNPTTLAGKRLGWLGNYNGHLPMEDGVLSLCENSLNDLAAAGAVVEPVLPEFDMESLFQAWVTLRNWGRIGMREYYENDDTRPLLKPELQWEIEQSYELSADDIYEANATRQRWYEEINRLFENYDFLLLPSAQAFPFDRNMLWPESVAGRQMDTYHRWMEVVIGASMTGIPVINLPVGFDARERPMGMQVMASFAGDKRVLEFALAYEQITTHLARRPTLV